jgi:hypothetical protein
LPVEGIAYSSYSGAQLVSLREVLLLENKAAAAPPTTKLQQVLRLATARKEKQ